VKAGPDRPQVTGLSAEEDAELRRIHELMPYVDRDSPIIERYHELRLKDRRNAVRDLAEEEVAQVMPPEQRTESPG